MVLVIFCILYTGVLRSILFATRCRYLSRYARFCGHASAFIRSAMVLHLPWSTKFNSAFLPHICFSAISCFR